MLNNNYYPIWHPLRQHGIEGEINAISRSNGAYLYDQSGNQVLDAISSWWVTTHGHCHPTITRAIQETVEQIDQVIFAEYTHDQALQLAYQLISLLPKNLTHVFYTDSGSTSVEVAIKMALGYFNRISVNKRDIVVMQYGYHGDTIGTMSAGDRGVYHTGYDTLLYDVHTISFPTIENEQTSLDQFTQICQSHSVAAIILEPLVLGAGGFLIYSPEYLRQLKAIADHYEVLFIVDEVMTGWGRTGSLFAIEHADISPDILCTSKGLTNGSLPLAATITTQKIFDAFYSSDRKRQFFHSSSYTANPIACSAAIANINIWKNENTLSKVHSLEKWIKSNIVHFVQNDSFSRVEHIGTISVFEFNTQSSGYFSDLRERIKKYFLDKFILVRPLGNVLYIMPPYCITPQEMSHIYNTLNDFILDMK